MKLWGFEPERVFTEFTMSEWMFIISEQGNSRVNCARFKAVLRTLHTYVTGCRMPYRGWERRRVTFRTLQWQLYQRGCLMKFDQRQKPHLNCKGTLFYSSIEWIRTSHRNFTSPSALACECLQYIWEYVWMQVDCRWSLWNGVRIRDQVYLHALWSRAYSTVSKSCKLYVCGCYVCVYTCICINMEIKEPK